MSAERTRVLVLGATGMLGHTLFERLSDRAELEVHATVRDPRPLEGHIAPDRQRSIHPGVDVARVETIQRVMAEVRPAVLVNAVGIVRQVPAARDPLVSIEVNALLPHRLSRLCSNAGVRLIHIGTDCVFSGAIGNYAEDARPDPLDLYGRTKLLGEPGDGALTLRTSIIGHELRSRHGLLEWFLAQEATVPGFRRAVFSGLPSVELARVVANVVIPDPGLAGVLHLSSAPISKLQLLELIARRYDHPVEIVPVDQPVLDRSLDSTRLRASTGYRSPTWPDLVDAMFMDAVERYPARFRTPVR